MSSAVDARTVDDASVIRSRIRLWLAGSARLTSEAALLGLVVGLLTVGPWIGHGYLVLLDWVSGPNQTITPSVFGLTGGAADAMPFRVLTQVLRDVVGSAATAWLLLLLFFPLAAAGAARLAGSGRWRRLPAALLFICNPFVIERVRAGHVSVLLGVALLPWVLGAAVDARRRGVRFAVRPAAWFALSMAVSPHAAWLGGVCLVAVAVLPRPTWRDLMRTLYIFVAAAAVYFYAAIVLLAGVKTLHVTSADLEAYKPLAGPGGLLPTLLSLHGFWRGGQHLPRDVVGPVAGAFLLVAVLAVVAVGLGRLIRVSPRLGWPLLVLSVLGLLLAAGIEGPMATPYRWAFDHIPLFQAMREQGKWLALPAMGYAIGFGAGIEYLVAWLRTLRKGRGLSVVTGIAVAALPLAIAPSLLWGLGGTVHTSTYPASWYAADAAMGTGDGQVLFLPWHGYQPFAFTGGRTVATPAQAFFRRTVLASDAVELPAVRTDSTSLRTAYVDRLVAGAGFGVFGTLVAPLGVSYVVVAKNSASTNYSWVSRQRGLVLVMHAPTLDLYRVTAEGTGRVVVGRGETFMQVVQRAQSGASGTEAALRKSNVSSSATSTAFGDIAKKSSVAWQVSQGAAGWTVIPEEYAAGWQAHGADAVVHGHPTVAGTIAFDLTSGPTTISYRPWSFLWPSLVLSVLFLIGLVVAGLFEHRREVRRLLRPPATGGA